MRDKSWGENGLGKIPLTSDGSPFPAADATPRSAANPPPTPLLSRNQDGRKPYIRFPRDSGHHRRQRHRHRQPRHHRRQPRHRHRRSRRHHWWRCRRRWLEWCRDPGWGKCHPPRQAWSNFRFWVTRLLLSMRSTSRPSSEAKHPSVKSPASHVFRVTQTHSVPVGRYDFILRPCGVINPQLVMIGNCCELEHGNGLGPVI